MSNFGYHTADCGFVQTSIKNSYFINMNQCELILKLYVSTKMKKNIVFETNLCSNSSTNFVCPLSAAIVRAVSRDDGTGGAFTSAPLSNSTLPTSTYPPLAASIRGVSPVFARCSTFAFRSSRRLTTSCRPTMSGC